MAQKLYYFILNTPAGHVGILGSKTGLLRITLPRHSAEEIQQLLDDGVKHAVCSPRLYEDLMKRLTAYFTGHKAEFPDCLDLATATDFQREVWEATRLIPYGETRSYAWVAEQIKKPKAVRAVGQALGKNPLPVIVPCHRVLASHGGLGGFSGGLEMKKHLLMNEMTDDIR